MSDALKCLKELHRLMVKYDMKIDPEVEGYTLMLHIADVDVSVSGNWCGFDERDVLLAIRRLEEETNENN